MMFRSVTKNLLLSLILLAMLGLNIATGQQVSLLDAARLESLQTQLPDLVVLDVRTVDEYRAGHVAGAINIPFDEIPQGLAHLNIDPSQPVVTYCLSGARAAVALQALHQAGFSKLGYLQGDFPGWEAAGRPVVAGDCRHEVSADMTCECGTGEC